MYTWGYLKDSVLAKLNLTEEEANLQGLLNTFVNYANEAMTQICSAIKPKREYFEVRVQDRFMVWNMLCKKYGVYTVGNIIEMPELDKNDDDYEYKKAFWDDYNSNYYSGDTIKLPEDFVSFIDEPVLRKYCSSEFTECYSDTVFFLGYNRVKFNKPGTYIVPYNARWYMFSKSISDEEEIDVPYDILDCIPSYIVSQCYKIDDEYKASVFRNEYELFLSRIDDTDFKEPGTLSIGGDW